MAHFLVINTGGTIGMAEGPNGLMPRAGEIENAIERESELSAWLDHEITWDHWSPLLDSSDLEPHHWYHIKATIEATIKEQTRIDGVLIIHGTDTLAFTSAALSFLLSDLGIPVVITGSMLPISARKTDAIANLTMALQALRTGRKEVMVAVGNQILPGSRVTKSSTLKMSSFETPRWDPSLWANSPQSSSLAIKNQWTNPAVALLNLYPGIPSSLLSVPRYLTDCRAILLNGYGNGNATNSEAMRQLLSQAEQASIPVFVHSQCLEGNVDFGLYAASAVFTDYGAISCGSMPLEAAITKLQILCSEPFTSEQIKTHFKQPIAREWQNSALPSRLA